MCESEEFVKFVVVGVDGGEFFDVEMVFEDVLVYIICFYCYEKIVIWMSFKFGKYIYWILVCFCIF